jgi:ParB family transcriptional regulator, chromosome partitioning protein
MYKFGRVAIDLVVPDPEQPRKRFEQDDLSRLSESLKRIGQQVAIIGYQDGDHFVLLDGERRLRAAKLAGISELSAAMLPGRPSKAQLRAIQNSLDAHREQLTPMERSNLVAEIQRETGWSVGQLAEELSLHQSVISKALAYQRLSPELQAMFQAGEIRTEQAYLISKTADFAEQLQLLKSADGLSREDVRAKVKNDGQPKPKAKRSVFILPCGMSFTVNGRETDLQGIVGGLKELTKQLQKGVAAKWDIHAAQKALRGKANGGGK